MRGLKSDAAILRREFAENQVLRELIESSATYGELWNYALKLEGLVRNVGVHAAGIVIGAYNHNGDLDVRKLSTRDLGAASAQRASGGTTVAATLAACATANIRVFATGGIGGVHRGVDLGRAAARDLRQFGAVRRVDQRQRAAEGAGLPLPGDEHRAGIEVDRLHGRVGAAHRRAAAWLVCGMIDRMVTVRRSSVARSR